MKNNQNINNIINNGVKIINSLSDLEEKISPIYQNEEDNGNYENLYYGYDKF